VNVVLPSDLINSRSGLIETFNVLFDKIGIKFMNPVVALIITIGSFGCLSAWMLALSKYVHKIAIDFSLPRLLTKKNFNDVPSNIMFIHGFIFSILCCVYLWIPNIQKAYWFLSDLTAQVALIANVIFLMSAVKLRSSFSWSNAYQISKYKMVSISIYIVGIIGSIIGFSLGFLSSQNTKNLNLMLVIGLTIIIVIPVIVNVLAFYKERFIK
jgi:L-asparagine transporter-like permease